MILPRWWNSDSLATLTAAGWAALEDYGIRTVVDLWNESEIGADAAPRPASIETLHIPLDVSEEREFWDVWESGPQFGTPLYYRPHLERFSPERLGPLYASRGQANPEPELEAFLRERGTTAGEVILATLAALDVEEVLLASGLDPADIDRLRERLLG